MGYLTQDQKETLQRRLRARVRDYMRFRDELGVSAQDSQQALRGRDIIRARGWDYTWEDDYDEDTGEKTNLVKLVDEHGTELARSWDYTFSSVGQAYEAGIMAFYEAGRLDDLDRGGLPPRMSVNPKTFETGTLVKKTSKFLRSIGSVTRGPVDGLVLGSSDTRLLVAWSDGNTYQIQAANVQKTQKQMEPASAKATVTAERKRTRQTMDTETWTPEEIDEVVASYVRDDLAANPRRPNPAPPQTTPVGLVGRLKF